MTSSSSLLSRKFALMCAGALASLVLALSWGAANAHAEWWFVGKLPGKAWTSEAAEHVLSFQIQSEETYGRSLCVGPVTYSGGYHFPYGWACNKFRVIWEYPAISAHQGVDNPNSVEIKFGGWAS